MKKWKFEGLGWGQSALDTLRPKRQNVRRWRKLGLASEVNQVLCDDGELGKVNECQQLVYLAIRANLALSSEKMMSEPLRISPHYTVSHWQALDFSREEDWQKGVNILEDRMRGRFLEPICRMERYTYAGFAVLALDCLLIETLQQFREGVAETPPGESPTFFVRFLTETSFGGYFSKETARMFYEQIRCGILHQAEVKGTSRILITEDVPLVKYTDDSQGLVINRKRFHAQLQQEFEAYVARVRDPSNQELREKFKEKMNYICRASAQTG